MASKFRSCPWTKSNKRPGPKREAEKSFEPELQESLAASDKGSWFDQPKNSEQSTEQYWTKAGPSTKKINLGQVGEEELVSDDYSSDSDCDSDQEMVNGRFVVVCCSWDIAKGFGQLCWL